MAASLKDCHVLMVIAPVDFRDEELFEPKALFESEGALVEVASTTLEPTRGMLGAEVKPSLTVAAADPHRYAAIVVVGGSGAQTHLWDNGVLHALLRLAHADGTPIGAIEDVVVDKGVITAAGPGSARPFAQAVLDAARRHRAPAARAAGTP